MTATVPHSPHFGHHSFPNPTPTLGSYASANQSLPNGSARLAPSHSYPSNTTHSNSRQLPPLRNMPPSHSTSQLQYANTRKRDRGPDWDEFYKNGPPKEIIVIDDDSPPPAIKRGENPRMENTAQATAGAPQPAAKKRRMTQTSAYNSVGDYRGSYSNARTYSHGDSASNTVSTDRTTSLQTTAPTSLGSHTSHGSNTGAYADDVGVGQKRKRVTRQQIADERKRKEANVVDAYVPPPKPPIKAKDVHVPTLRDVCRSQLIPEVSLTGSKAYTAHLKVDDEDGHYIVICDSMIGERCKNVPVLKGPCADVSSRQDHKASRPRDVRQSG